MRQALLKISELKAARNVLTRKNWLMGEMLKQNNWVGIKALKEYDSQIRPDHFAARGEIVKMFLTGTDELRTWLREQIVTHPGLADYISKIDDNFDPLHAMDLFVELKTIANLCDIVTQEMLDRIETYHKEHFGRPKFIPDMLGDLYTKLVGDRTDGKFFKTARVGFVRKLFKIRRGVSLIDAGFITEYKHTLLISPKRDRAAVLKYVDEETIKEAKATGCFLVKVYVIVGIDYESHKLWHQVETGLHEARLEAGRNYPANRRKRAKMKYYLPNGRESRKGLKHKKHKKHVHTKPHKPHKTHSAVNQPDTHTYPTKRKIPATTRLIWSEKYNKYFTAAEYSEATGCSISTARNVVAKLPYVITMGDLNSGQIHNRQ